MGKKRGSEAEPKLRKIADVAKRFGISETSVYATKRKFDDFPAKGSDGYDARTIDEFCHRHGLWHYKAEHTTEANEEQTLRQALTRKTLEQAENERIKKERQLVQQQIELGNILLKDDVHRLFHQTIALVMNLQDSLYDAIDRELPDDFKGRERVLAHCQKLNNDVAAAMQELVKS